MGRTARFAVVVGVAIGITSGPPAEAIMSKAQFACQTAAAKAAGKFLTSDLRLRDHCMDANLTSPGACVAVDPEDLARIDDKLGGALAKKCAFEGLDAMNLANMGYPGPCADSDPGNGFTVGDLQACLRDSHDDRLTGVCAGGSNLGESCTTVADCPDGGPGTLCYGMMTLQYDPDGFGIPTNSAAQCQQAVVKSTSHYLRVVLASIQRCRQDLLNCKIVSTPGGDVTKCKLEGFTPEFCATSDPRAAKKIANTRNQVRASLRGQCSDDDAIAIGMCEPDQPTRDAGIECLIGSVDRLVQDPDPDGPVDLIDFEYPQ